MKRYIIRKYVMADSLKDAMQKEQTIRPDEVWLDDKQPEQTESVDVIGFHYSPPNNEE